MIISYYGNLCVKAQIGDMSVAFNPPFRSDGKTPRFSSNIAFFSTKEKGQSFEYKTENGGPFIIDGPGEYEVGGIFIKGVGMPQVLGEDKKINTIYSVLFEDIHLCHLGAIDTSEISPEIQEAIGTADILFVPITGGDLATPQIASKLTTLMEPRIIIPMTSTDKGVSDESLKVFLKEEGSESVSAVDKLTIKKKDLEGKEGEIIVLSPVS